MIADFGLTVEGSTSRWQTTKFSRGSPGYRAPELLNEDLGKSMYNNKVDIWALGCIFYEIMFRTKAFSSDYSTQKMAQAREHPPIPSDTATIPKDMEEQVGGCVKRMLAWDPNSRPKALELCQEFTKSLEAVKTVPRDGLPGNISILASPTQPSATSNVQLEEVTSLGHFLWWIGHTTTFLSGVVGLCQPLLPQNNADTLHFYYRIAFGAAFISHMMVVVTTIQMGAKQNTGQVLYLGIGEFKEILMYKD
jgi:serine/threonine protein kinase